jgi:hypothetical protein
MYLLKTDSDETEVAQVEQKGLAKHKLNNIKFKTVVPESA